MACCVLWLVCRRTCRNFRNIYKSPDQRILQIACARAFANRLIRALKTKVKRQRDKDKDKDKDKD